MLGDFDALWRHPDTATLFLRIRAGRAPAVRELLAQRGSFAALDRVPGLHLLRAFVVDAMSPEPERLVINAVFDDRRESLFGAMLARCPAWRDVLRECEDISCDSADLPRWLAGQAVRPQLHYLGVVRASLATLKEELALHDAVQAYLDQHRDELRNLAPDAVRSAVREHVRKLPGLPHGRRPPDPGAWLLEGLGLLRSGAVLAVPALLVGLLLRLPWGWLALFVLVVTPALLGLARQVPKWVQRFEHDVVVEPDPAHVAKLLDLEDHGPTNQFTMLTEVRPTAWRRLNLRFVLFAGQILVRHIWRWGKLVGVDTIHAARIHQIDGGRRMLFMSDFDGSWDRYLFDFLTTGAFAVVPIWTNNHGCPPEGHKDFARRFLPFTRARQLPTDLWYCAMPDVTVAEMLRNARIRSGLYGNGDARAWLELL